VISVKLVFSDDGVGIGAVCCHPSVSNERRPLDDRGVLVSAAEHEWSSCAKPEPMIAEQLSAANKASRRADRDAVRCDLKRNSSMRHFAVR
jgi:hypothetical protein